MKITQLIGILLLIAGGVLVFIGGQNVLDLLDLGGNSFTSSVADIGYQIGGSSLTEQWIKWGGITAGGVVAIFIGIKFIKK